MGLLPSELHCKGFPASRACHGKNVTALASVSLRGFDRASRVVFSPVIFVPHLREGTKTHLQEKTRHEDTRNEDDRRAE